MKKLISTLLAVLMLIGAFTVVVSAETADGPVYSTNTGNGNSLLKYDKDTDTYAYKTGTYVDANGKDKVIETAEEKIALMDYRYGTDKFELYVDAYSGEVAIRSKATGETLFTNPYTIGKSTATASDGSTKDEIMSQLIVHYTDVKTDQNGTLYSYTWSAVRKQISVMNIKGGIRVEYTIGREESKSLLPRMIEASAYEEIVNTIRTNMEAAIASGMIAENKVKDERHRLEQFEAYYSKYSLKDAINQEMHDKYCEDYPILEKFEQLAQTDPGYDGFAIYVLDEANMGEQTIKKQEGLIKEYCKEYTFQDLEEDHAFVEYEAKTENYPLFKMALEYTVEASGLVVRLPANGIRFNEALYRLDYIEILPYMGAGMNPNRGYTFFPDGSGTLFDFEKIAILGTRQSVSGKVYGQDFAYHEPSGMYEEVIRYPVFGVYEEEKLTKVETDSEGNVTTTPYTKDRGYVAIVEEGDSLIELSTVHGGVASEYNTMRLSVYPRPTDSYNIADAISVGSNTEWTVVSARKYTGSYKVRYIMLTDNDVAEAARAAGKTAESYYEPSYVGMAIAYRDYLSSDLNKVLERLGKDDVSDDIPLYIESFGALKTTEKFLSIPIDVMTPLTTFEDVQTMYKNLKDSGITNVNFILKGFTKGGMTNPRVPYNLQWESAVSKEMDFDELTEYAKQEGFGIFPDFDFVFSSTNTLFDGLTLNKHAAKTIDNRYTSKREYSATKHTYVSYYELALSPAYFSHFYEKFIPRYKKYSPVGISVSTLGSYLNSDFDEDEPYNRADGQNFTEQAFEYISSEMASIGAEVMTSGGNAYSWKYVDHITDIALDSSRFSISSASVPFLGIVLHGSVEIAGTPINMEGNLDYAFLKAIESGAAMKFVLSYRNTEKLKDYETLSQYYSVNYDIWYDEGKGDLITMYHELNEALKDVQTSVIIGHEFIPEEYVTRVPDDDELILDAEQEIKDAIEYESALANANSESERKAIYEARQLILKGCEILKNSTNDADASTLAGALKALKAIYNGTDAEVDQLLAAANKALVEYQAAQQFHAIYSDNIVAHTYGAHNTVYKVEDAIKAYEAYVAATTDEERNASKWETYKAILGTDYSTKLEDMLQAKAAYEAAPEDAALKATYEAAVETLNAAKAGKVIDLDAAVAAMNNAELVALKEAYIADASKKAEFEAKVLEVYGELVKGYVYSITYNGVAIGGSQYCRDLTKTAYADATKALDEKLAELYSIATKVMDEQEKFEEKYNLEAIEAALTLLENKKAFSDEERAALAAIVADLKNNFDTTTFETAMAYKTADAMNALNDAYKALYDATDAAGKEIKVGVIVDYEISGLKAADYLKTSAYTWSEKIAETNETVIIEKPQSNTKKYVADDNKVVLETFDNGKQFLLNFNDYRVVVTLGDTLYTLEAYGYLVVNKANNA